jgi:hypothetical protein
MTHIVALPASYFDQVLKAEVTAADPDAEVGACSAVLSRSAGGCTGRSHFLGVHLSSGKRGSAHHSLRRLRVARYPVLRMESPERSPRQAPRDGLYNPSYRRRFSVWLAHAA